MWRTLEVCEVALLVEARLVETERVDDIDLGLGRVIGTLLLLLGGGIGTSVCGTVRPGKCIVVSLARTESLASDSDLGAVGLVGDAVNLLEVVRVGDDLVTGDDVLEACQYYMSGSGARGCSAGAGCSEAQQGRRGSCAGRVNCARAGGATDLVNDHIGSVVYVKVWLWVGERVSAGRGAGGFFLSLGAERKRGTIRA